MFLFQLKKNMKLMSVNALPVLLLIATVKQSVQVAGKHNIPTLMA